jgi:hypothetical protein
VFARLPTIDYGGMRVLHPDYQRLDMHLAFCYPFNGAPREDVFHRWAKDVKRFNILQAEYPIRAGSLATVGGGTAAASMKAHVDLGEESIALHGIAAFGLLLAALRELRETVKLPADGKWPQVVTTVGKTSIEVSLPSDHAAAFEYIAIATPRPLEVCDTRRRAGDTVQWYEPYMDARPETAVITGSGAPLHVFSTSGRQLAVVAVKAGEGRALMVTPQYLLLHFLLEAHLAPDESVRSTLTQYYAWTLAILYEGATTINKMATTKENGFDRGKFINSSPFGLTTRTMGATNHNDAYIINIATMAQAVGDTPPASLGLGVSVKKILDGLPPRGYYPPKTRPAKFDYTKNALFQRSGKATAGPIMV